MKFAHTYPKGLIMFLFIILFFIECGVKHPVSVAVSAPEIVTSPYIAVPIPVKQVDTPQNKPIQRVISQDKPIVSEIKQNAAYSPISDTLFKRNLELQRIAIRIIDRARDVRLQKDSAMALLKGIRDTVNATKAATKTAKENQTIVKNTNQMFDFIILACLIICTLGTLIGWIKPYIHKIHSA